MTRKVIAEPTGELCSENPCQCECWCKAVWHIRYEEGGEDEYKGCAGMAARASGTIWPAKENLRVEAARRSASLTPLFRSLGDQQPKRWVFQDDGKLVPRAEYWRRGDGKAQLPAGATRE